MYFRCSVKSPLTCGFNLTATRGLGRVCGQLDLLTVDTVSQLHIPISSFKPWWPRGCGPSPARLRPLYDVTVTATPQLDGGARAQSSSLGRRVGFRSVELVREPLEGEPGETFFFRVNGTPVFMKGTLWALLDVCLCSIDTSVFP